MKTFSVLDNPPEFEKRVLGIWSADKIEGVCRTNLDGEEYWYYLQDGDACSTSPILWTELPTIPQ